MAELDKYINVYQRLHPAAIDNQLVKYKKFILQPHQTIPKYYLVNHSQFLVAHVIMGGGKTSLALFTAMHYLEQQKQKRFIDLYKNATTRRRSEYKPIYVVGSWTTQNAFINDMLRPEFHFIQLEDYEEMQQKLKSSFRPVREEGEKLRQQFIRAINKNLLVRNYQGFFNDCFPELASTKYTQDVSVLMAGYKQGTVAVSPKFLMSLRDSILIVDEMQRMYSSEGMNTYGFAVACVAKSAIKYNIKIMFLTGTIFNTSLFELPDVLNILNPDPIFEDKSIYLNEETILGDTIVYRVRKNMEKVVLEKFSTIFLYYNPKSVSVLPKYSSRDINIRRENTKFRLSIPADAQTSTAAWTDTNEFINSLESLKKIEYKGDAKNYLPDEIHIGNIMINALEDINSRELVNPMCLYSLEVEGYQKEAYAEYLKSRPVNSLGDDDEEDSGKSSVHDGFFPSKQQLSDNGIYKSGSIYTGVGLKYPHVKQYSAIAAEMVRFAVYNTLNREKMIVYHDKINGFGLKQYIEILGMNGFIPYGTTPKHDTRCYACGVTQEQHTTLKHQFIPMRYGVLFGEMSNIERRETTEIYNSPYNIEGELISVMFISSVAHSGVSFFNTNHIMILNKISNLSKWRQIYARIIRTHSHDLLPESKRFANVYTMIIEYPDEKKVYKTKMTAEEKYYKLRNVLNYDITNWIDRIGNYKGNVCKMLLERPEEYMDITKKTEESNMLSSDIENELALIFKRIDMVPDRPWQLRAFLNRLKDRNHSLSFIDLSEYSNQYILGLLMQQQLIKIIQVVDNSIKVMSDDAVSKQNYTYINDMFVIPYNENAISAGVIKVPSFRYDDWKYLDISSRNIQLILIELSSTKLTVQDAIRFLGKLMMMIGNAYERLVDLRPFWDQMYAIHNEYYSDDETHFVRNHTANNRDITKMAGCYYGDNIVLKTGKLKPIPKIMKVSQGFTSIPYKFHITTKSRVETSFWYLHLNILKQRIAEDARLNTRGVVCTSFNTEELLKHFPGINRSESKNNVCRLIISEICGYQLSRPNEQGLLTPFNR